MMEYVIIQQLYYWENRNVHFISPAVAQITWKWIPKKKAYEHFGMPLFSEINAILSKLNVKYKFFRQSISGYRGNEIWFSSRGLIVITRITTRTCSVFFTDQTNKLIFFSSEGSFWRFSEEYSAGDKTKKIPTNG
jgi:ATP-dependent DNA helicase RecG